MHLSYLRFSIAIGASLLLANILVAQGTKPTTPPSPAIVILQALKESRTLFEKDSPDQAEAKLQDLNRSKQGTAEWHIESALNLLRVAFSCQESGEIKTAQNVAQRALGHLDQAQQTSPSPAMLSSIHETRGMIFERLFGSIKDAKTSYEAAVSAQPGNLSAQGKLKRIEAANK
jgi:hypothetical protein